MWKLITPHMGANLIYAAFSGLLGAVVMVILLYILKMVGLKVDLPSFIGKALSKEGDQSGGTFKGVLVLLVIGILWGLFDITLMMGTTMLPSWGTGLLYGFANGIFMGMIAGTLVDSKLNVGKGKAVEDPGMFFHKWGLLSSVSIVVLYIIYGFTTLVIYTSLYGPQLIPRARIMYH